VQRSLRRFWPTVLFGVSLGVISLGIMAVKEATSQETQTSTEGWRAPARAAKKKNPVPFEANSIDLGKAVYARECLSCHGVTGKGNGPSASGLEKHPGDFTNLQKMNQQSDGELFWKITEGNKPMASFKKTLTEEERWHVVNYLRTLIPKEQK